MSAAGFSGPDFAEVRAAAEAAIASLVQHPGLGLAGYRPEGIHYKPLNPARPDKSPGSFVIDIGGRFPGRWKDFASGDGGDVIDLVSYCLTLGGNFRSGAARREALLWLARELGLGGPGAAAVSDVRREELAREREAARARAEAEAGADLEDRARRAAAMWLAGAEAGLARAYLQHRGYPVDDLPAWPGALRWSSFQQKQSGEMVFRMLSAMARTGPDGKGAIRAVHVIELGKDGRKIERHGRAKWMFGDVRGAAVRLAKGPTRLSPEKAAAVGRADPLMICEGVEDAVGLALIYPEARVWAAGSVDNIGAIAEVSGWPGCASEVVIVSDNDPAGAPARAALERAVGKWIAVCGGREVKRLEPLGVKDINDLWITIDE